MERTMKMKLTNSAIHLDHQTFRPRAVSSSNGGETDRKAFAGACLAFSTSIIQRSAYIASPEYTKHATNNAVQHCIRVS